jgi:hypothetical protein
MIVPRMGRRPELAMAEVLNMPPLTVDTQPGSAHWRIRWTSRALSWLFTLCLAGYGAFAAALILAFVVPYAGSAISIGSAGMELTIGAPRPPPGYIAVGSLPLVQRLAHVPAGFIVATPMLVMFWNLRRLFGLYGRGIVFARENAVCLKWVGLALAADAAAPFTAHGLLQLTGFAIDQHWIHFYSLQELVLGGIVWVIAQVMEVGREIEDERSQFV